jgi:hypothetical protein
LGISDEEAWAKRSATQQDKFNAQIDSLGRMHIAEFIVPCLEKILKQKTNGQVRLSIDQADGHAVVVQYPASFAHSYLLDYIKLEIGPRSARVPYEDVAISSYAAQEYPKVFFVTNFIVRTITCERSFWEKATILHQIASIGENKLPTPRYSRHYYDMFQMANSAVKPKALADLKLLRDVAMFKSRFYRSPSARYDLAKPGTFKILPSEKKRNALVADYTNMREMIFGEIPDFSEIMDGLAKLEIDINNCK